MTSAIQVSNLCSLLSYLTPSSAAKDLIQHLLCVDPAQRYTIDEFLAHPWCSAVPAPLPPPTPFTYPASSLPLQSRPLDSPLLRGHGRGSPGIATLKEAFDITYAVHRMEEEGNRRGRGAGADGGGARRWLGGLNEDDEDEDDEDADADAEQDRHRIRNQAVAKRSVAGREGDSGHHGRAGQMDRSERGQRRTAASASTTGGGHRGFELDLDGATLLGRRHGGKKMGAVGSSPLAAGVANPVSQRMGSPMRIS